MEFINVNELAFFVENEHKIKLNTTLLDWHEVVRWDTKKLSIIARWDRPGPIRIRHAERLRFEAGADPLLIIIPHLSLLYQLASYCLLVIRKDKYASKRENNKKASSSWKRTHILYLFSTLTLVLTRCLPKLFWSKEIV